MPNQQVRQLIDSLPTHGTPVLDWEQQSGISRDRFPQATNVRQLLEILSSQGTPTKGAGEFAADPELMSRLALRFSAPERAEQIKSQAPGTPKRPGASEDWDVAGVIHQLTKGRLAPEVAPEPTPAMASAPTQGPGWETQTPQDVLRDLLIKRKEPYLVSRPEEYSE